MDLDSKYISGCAKAEGGGAICLQQAQIVKNREIIDIVFAIVFAKHDTESVELSKEMGEWFQNIFSVSVLNNGPEILKHNSLQNIFGKKLVLRASKVDCAGILIAGNILRTFGSGNSSAIYTTSDIFGKKKFQILQKCSMIELSDASLSNSPDENTVFEIGEGSGFALTDITFENKSNESEIVDYLHNVPNEYKLNKFLDEITISENEKIRAIIFVGCR